MKGPAPYRGARFAILTQHGKERVIAPPFVDRLGVRLELATGFDTDTLGTFTRDVPRRGSQLEAARTKARKGMELLGLDQGVASEGSFGHDPFGLFPWNVEVVVLIDRQRAIEIVGTAQGPARHAHARVATREALEVFARRVEFPAHGLVLRPDGEDGAPIRKGVADWPALHAAFDSARSESRSATVFVETELRAHLNPTRMELIRQAAENLVDRIRSACPRCGSPGFWCVERIAGLPCRQCGSPTDEPRAERWGCVTSDHFETRNLNPGRSADPRRCETCNP